MASIPNGIAVGFISREPVGFSPKPVSRAAWGEPGALSVLRNYGIRSCLINRDEALGTLLAASPDWKRVYSDSVAALYVHQGGWRP